MRKVFFLVLICFLMASLIAKAQIITVGVTADILSYLELHFNDVSVFDWWFFSGNEAATTIAWDGDEQELAETTGGPDSFLESSIYVLQVRSSSTWDLTVTMPDNLETDDGFSVPLTWQFGENSTLEGVSYSSGSISQKGLNGGFPLEEYTRYLRFRIPYYWGMAPGEYRGTGSIVAVYI